jgi:hypothetical protein
MRGEDDCAKLRGGGSLFQGTTPYFAKNNQAKKKEEEKLQDKSVSRLVLVNLKDACQSRTTPIVIAKEVSGLPKRMPGI